VLRRPRSRADTCLWSHRRRDLHLRRRHHPLPHRRTPLPPIASPHSVSTRRSDLDSSSSLVIPSSFVILHSSFPMDTLSVFFLAEGEQPAAAVMARLTAFIRAATQTLDFALYDMRLSAPLRAELVAALRERANAGVQVRF